MAYENSGSSIRPAVRFRPALASILAVAAALAASPGLHASQRGIPPDRVERELDVRLAEAVDSGFNGVVLVAIDGRTVLHRGYGWTDAERTIPVVPGTRFWIASISKQFAAAAILRLREQGRLSLDDPIDRFFPWAPAEKGRITIHQLLTHTAGLEQHYAADGIADRDEAVRAILAPPLLREPGTGFRYSNDAYNLLAAIVEVAAAQPYETYLRDQLLRPAGLMNTGFWGPPDHPEVAPIHWQEPSDSTNLRPNWGFRGGVGMYSTAGDLYRWYQVLDRGGVLSHSSRSLLLSAHVSRGDIGVGYGWFVSTKSWGARSVWTRGFESFGHGAVLATYPDEGVVIVVVSNSGEWAEGPVTHVLADELAEVVFVREESGDEGAGH